MSDNVRVAIVQGRPAFLDLGGCLEKAADLAADAARGKAKLAAFGETWLPGYPAWFDECTGAAMWNHPPAKDAFARLHTNSIAVPGPETERLGKLARDLGLVIVMGANEKVLDGPGHGSLYNTLLIFDADGRLANHHRKLVPTYTERLVHAHGDGHGLQAVDTACGRVGGLICWEHWMPLTRQTMHDSAEKIHVAAWPTAHEVHQIASRHYAFEGRCFVLAAGSITHFDDLPGDLRAGAADGEAAAKSGERLALRGGSAIIGPDGRYVVEPVFDEETILYADIDLAETIRESHNLDTSGHYFRNDVFELKVNRSRR